MVQAPAARSRYPSPGLALAPAREPRTRGQEWPGQAGAGLGKRAAATCRRPRASPCARARARAHEDLAQEAAKAQRWRDENVRRKANCIPLLFNLLRLLAEKGRLAPLMAAARQAEAAKQRGAGQGAGRAGQS